MTAVTSEPVGGLPAGAGIEDRLDLLNARLDTDPGADSHLMLVANQVEIDAQDPGDVFVSTRAKRKDHDGHGWNHPTPVRTSGRTPAPPRYWPQPSRQDPRRDHGPAR